MNSSYPYLIGSLVLLITCLAGITLFSREKQKILISALLAAPAASVAVFFVPQYWEPIRITKFPVGIEDVIFSFATGGIVWMIVSLSVGRNFSYNMALGIAVKRYLTLAIIGGSLIYILERSTNWSVMFKALSGILFIGLLLMVRFRFKAWRIAAAGSLLFTLYYFIFTGITLKLFPNMILYWNKDFLWGISILQVPLEEIVWALAFGAVWPITMAYVFNLNLPERAPKTAFSFFSPRKIP